MLLKRHAAELGNLSRPELLRRRYLTGRRIVKARCRRQRGQKKGPPKPLHICLRAKIRPAAESGTTIQATSAPTSAVPLSITWADKPAMPDNVLMLEKPVRLSNR